ncbi:hypothetical protein NDU88_004442, partial [Pleurodeles waltl]
TRIPGSRKEPCKHGPRRKARRTQKELSKNATRVERIWSKEKVSERLPQLQRGNQDTTKGPATSQEGRGTH